MDLLKHFPYEVFPKIRPSQKYVLEKIQSGLERDKKIFVVEAPTGIGKSAIAMTVARYMNGAYILTVTKELQTQYRSDFEYIRKMTGRNNHLCFIRQEMLNEKECKECKRMKRTTCIHVTAEYGPCKTDPKYKKGKCYYHTKPDLENYRIDNKGSIDEDIVFIKPKEACHYFDQKNKGMLASYAVLNYALYFNYFRKSILYDNERPINPELLAISFDEFQTQLENEEKRMRALGLESEPPKPDGIGARRLVVFDECHNIEKQIIELVGYTINKKRYRFITGLDLPSEHKLKDGDTISWLELLKDYIISFKKHIDEKNSEREYIVLKLEMAERKLEFETRGDLEDEIKMLKEEIHRIDMEIKKLEESRDTATDTYNKIKEKTSDWVVSIKKNSDKGDPDYKNRESITFKPIDISQYCARLFGEKFGECFLLMSATILDRKTFCESIGLNPDQVEFITLESEFPLDNRPIYYVDGSPYLDYDSLNGEKRKYILDQWAGLIDQIMTEYSNCKGIIHVNATSYMNEIKKRLSPKNAVRLISSRDDNNEVTRDEVMEEHRNSKRPTVIISPSFDTGIDLKDNLSRFQIIAKVPYPGMNDAWIKKKRERNKLWYEWLTTLKFTQAYGRSIRSVTDWADTFLIDSCFRKFIDGNSMKPRNNFIPKWVRSAIKHSISIGDVDYIARKRGL